MSNNLAKYRVRILCEDRTQYEFMRGFLTDQGIVSNRRILPCCPFPEGTQSGEQFVREHFVDAYNTYACTQENVLLVVVQDIDRRHRSANDARNALEKLVQETGAGGLSAPDKLLLVFPKRNIETWFAWFMQDPPAEHVSEDTNYKQRHMKLPSGKLGKRASALLRESLIDPTVCTTAPESLVDACERFRNLQEHL